MKKLKIVLYGSIVIFLLVITLVIWLQRDEPLSDISNELFSLQLGYQADLKEHPYFMILGMDAKQNIDPMLLGRLRYHQYWAYYFTSPLMGWEDNNRLESKITSRFTDDIDEVTKKLLLDLNENRDKGIDLKLLKVNEQKLILGFNSNRYLIQRHLKIVQQKNYSDLALPANSPLLNYSSMLNSHYLYISKLALDRNNSVLRNYIDNLLLQYTNTTNLVYKMILHRMIDSSLTLLHFLANEQNTPINVTPMTDQQLSYKNVFGGELNFLKTSFPSYEDYIRNDFTDNEVLDNSLPMRTIRKSNLFFLPNMTINQIASQYLPYIKLSESPYVKFKQRVNLIKDQEQAKQTVFKLKNFIGNILANIGSPAFADYLVRSRLLDNKIRVFNVLHSGNDWSIEQLNLNKEGYEFYKTQDKLCIRSPYLKKVDWNQDSCLGIQ
ncbi:MULTISPECIES: hypothetical protein [unclassified Acinetobacter]|uniref:hypothetical protein n=1 Tax=unclassified Acinetobacter TaxID=196816 RepID=UPI00244C8137|nr:MULTISPECIES: hypothetical protein [unclassified Acinetobacter]MDH0033012.1 hypothetical protein [Acinetobacter sp. GD04021]MDH0888386.1 hypothetical protein [Acinetobacter sp. GD03873]MDH1084797.1 hypothetical protein [Acinetobacter sp. GD03983]MDH2191686.1 hypothetical protein [Acinetobacter sp. GD03645]MDH2205303.1 hypothetical protein [Acinetobacter sp. GD03647]